MGKKKCLTKAELADSLYVSDLGFDKQDVETQKSANITQMHKIVNSGSAHIQTYERWVNGLKFFLLSTKCVVYPKRMLHAAKVK